VAAEGSEVLVKRTAQNIAISVFGYFVALAILLPILWIVISAFRPESDIVGAPYDLPRRVTLQNFIELWQIPGFGHSLINSLLVACFTTIATASAALPIGYLISRYRFTGRRLLKTIALFGYLFAPAILALPYFQLLATFGLVDSLAGIVFTHVAFCLPFSLALTELIFRSVPASIEEVAMLDGSGLARRILTVVVPAARYQVAALLLLVFTISWKEFFFAFLISAGDRTRTLPVLLATLYGGESLNWHLLCALSTVLALPSVLILLWGRAIRVVPLVTAGSRG
jgi:ABC-type glycerol-3-phosphate transport system permease component